MAARVGTGVTGATDFGGTTVVSAAKTTTSGNMLFAIVKWETAATISTIVDTAGNTYVLAGSLNFGSSDPVGSLYYAENITGNASNVVTVTFSSSAAEYRRIVVEEFSGLATSSSTDGAAQTNSGTGTSYSTADITTTQSGLVVLGVCGYTTLSSWSGTPGNPDFTVGAVASDTGFLYLISGSAQTVTPAASATGSANWVAIARAWKDAGGGGGGAVGSGLLLAGARNRRVLS